MGVIAVRKRTEPVLNADNLPADDHDDEQDTGVALDLKGASLSIWNFPNEGKGR